MCVCVCLCVCVCEEWKNAILILLHKKQSRKDCNNYRGIAVLSVPGKVLPLILHSRLHNRTTALRGTVWVSEGLRNY